MGPGIDCLPLHQLSQYTQKLYQQIFSNTDQDLNVQSRFLAKVWEFVCFQIWEMREILQREGADLLLMFLTLYGILKAVLQDPVEQLGHKIPLAKQN